MSKCSFSMFHRTAKSIAARAKLAIRRALASMTWGKLLLGIAAFITIPQLLWQLQRILQDPQNSFHFKKACHDFVAQSESAPKDLLRGIQERCQFFQERLRRVDHGLGPVEIEEIIKPLDEFIQYVKLHSPPKLDTKGFRAVIKSVAINLEEQTRLPQRQHGLEALGSRALDYLLQTQDPMDCKSTSFLVCDAQSDLKGKGFGHRLNFATQCLAAALASKRRLLLGKPEDFLLHKFFLPVSTNCKEHDQGFMATFHAKSGTLWPDSDPSKPVVMTFEVQNNTRLFPARLPPNIPAEMGTWEKLHQYTSDPSIWYVGILTSYLMRIRYEILHSFVVKARGSGLHLEAERTLPSSIGIHIRRSDKNCEAPYQPLSKYMAEAELFAAKKTTDPRPLIVLATDDAQILPEIRSNYTKFKFIANQTSMAKSVGASPDDVHNYNAGDAIVLDVIYEIFCLTKSEHFIGTFSSNMGRVVYQLRMSNLPNAGLTSRSIDCPWFGVEIVHKAIIKHTATRPMELDLEPGDLIRNVNVQELTDELGWTKGDVPILYDGISYGFNLRAQRYGSYPGFKAERFQAKPKTA